MASGFIYIMTNPSLIGQIKIGLTSRNPKERADELSRTTSIPTPFEVIWSCHVSDMNQAEKLAHETLSQYRTNKKREFFQVDPAHAMAALERVARRFPSNFSLVDISNSNFDGPLPYTGNENWNWSKLFLDGLLLLMSAAYVVIEQSARTLSIFGAWAGRRYWNALTNELNDVAKVLVTIAIIVVIVTIFTVF